MSDTTADLVRLSKRMSELGLCSRREADEWIAKGWVKVDGEVVSELGSKVRPDQKIKIDRKAKDQQNERVTIILNKPLGYVSGQAEDGHEPARVLITPRNRWIDDPSPRRFNPSQLKSLVPAGRLDINSTGLLVLTQDGRIAKTIIGENSSVEKEYIVRVAMADGRPNSEFPPAKLALLNHGLELDGKPLEKAEVSWLNEDQLKFVLREGRILIGLRSAKRLLPSPKASRPAPIRDLKARVSQEEIRCWGGRQPSQHAQCILFQRSCSHR